MISSILKIENETKEKLYPKKWYPYLYQEFNKLNNPYSYPITSKDIDKICNALELSKRSKTVDFYIGISRFKA